MGDTKKKKKSNTWKWVLGGCLVMFVLGALVVGIGGYMIYSSVTTDPAEVQNIADEMVELTPPEGVSGQFGISLFGFKMAFLASSRDANSGTAIVLVSVPGSDDKEKMKEEMKKSLKEQGKDREVVEKRDNETFTVKGKEVDSTVEITADDKGENRAIQYTFVLDGKNGKPVLMLIMGPETEVNHATVQALLDTVK